MFFVVVADGGKHGDVGGTLADYSIHHTTTPVSDPHSANSYQLSTQQPQQIQTLNYTGY